MTEYSDIEAQLLLSIEANLRKSYEDNRRIQITYEVLAEVGAGRDQQTSAKRAKRTRELMTQVTVEFNELWNSRIQISLQNQSRIFYDHILSKIRFYHNWLTEEQNSSQDSLIDTFFSKHFQPLLFDLLLDKSPASAKSWQDIIVDPRKQFQWSTIDAHKLLDNQIRCYPLSDPAFYDNRALPTYLHQPFYQNPTRYDIYRLLKNIYPEKFKTTPLGQGIACTKIAPMHFSELRNLSSEELNHLETIVVNVADENNPQWVLLDKKHGAWTGYMPQVLVGYCRDKIPAPLISHIEAFSHVDSISSTHAAHAILLSRVLPWTQLSDAERVSKSLQNYIDAIPIRLLAQNALEASCLTAQDRFSKLSTKAYTLSDPFSRLSVDDLYTRVNPDEILFSNISQTAAAKVIKLLDDGYINLSNRTLTINSPDQWQEAMKLAYYYKVTSLTITNSVTAPDNNLKDWFAYNLDLQEVFSPPGKGYAYIYACAARNRFLAATHADYLASPNHDARRKAWENTGEFIYEFLNGNVESSAGSTELANIAYMGTEGLDTLFNYLEKYSHASLACTLSLDSGKATPISEYIQALENKVKAASNRPLFTKLDLVLPDKLDDKSQDALCNLVKELNARGELVAINVSNLTAIKSDLITKLTDLAEKDEKICLQIYMPELDVKECSLKAEYLNLQNTILANIRKVREKRLNEDTATLAHPKAVAFPIKSLQAQDNDASWEDNTYYLSKDKASCSVQQEVQQEVSQEVQQQAQNESKPAAPAPREIKPYVGDQNGLVTRSNLNGVSLANFSAWVGSAIDAQFVVQKIDGAARAQIEAFPNLFKFGIDVERTPGFRLCYVSEQNHNLILTYDAALVEQDIADQQQDPFALRMNDQAKLTVFDGDYRQFAALTAPLCTTAPLAGARGSEAHESASAVTEPRASASAAVPEPAQLALWRHLAHELGATSELQQYQNVHTNKYRQELPEITAVLQNAVDEVATEVTATPHNLKALGQLFYRYGAPGTAKWLALVQKIQAVFPDYFNIFKERLLDPLDNWAEILAPAEVEAVTASMAKLNGHRAHQEVFWVLVEAHGKNVGRMRFAEVWQAYDAVLKQISKYDLEFDAQQFLEAINNYQGEFNASQFLRRVSAVLDHTGNRSDSKSMQQNILANLSKIDWHENGFYYACVHENYRYWDPALQLAEFAGSERASYVATWDVVTDINDPKLNTLRYAAQKLQLNSQDFEKFKGIVESCPNDPNLLRLLSASLALGVDTVASLQGIDFDKFHGHQEILGNLSLQLHTELSLDSEELASRSYHVKLQHLPVLLAALAQHPEVPRNLATINALGRALQCYEAQPQASAAPTDLAAKLEKLIDLGSSHGFDHPLITAYPWLDASISVGPPSSGANTPSSRGSSAGSREAATQKQRFYQQLSSIDFVNSRLPRAQQLTETLTSITSPETRREAVSALLEQGCNITDQDADFRALNTAEIKLFEEVYLSKTFKESNCTLLEKLVDNLALKEEGNDKAKIQELLDFFTSLDRKPYYDELGQVLSMLLQEASPNRYYATEQLTTFLKVVFDNEQFKRDPYPVAFIQEVLRAELQKPHSSLLSQDLAKLKTVDPSFDTLQAVLRDINQAALSYQAKKTLVKLAVKFVINSTEQRHEESYFKFKEIFEQLRASPKVTAALASFIDARLADPSKLLDPDTLTTLTQPCPDKDFAKLWEDNQLKVLAGLSAGTLSDEQARNLLDADTYKRMILLAAFKDHEDAKQDLNFSGWQDSEIKKLDEYYKNDPRPTLKQLQPLLNRRYKTADALIEDFERVVQAGDKRNYSLLDEDAISIKRVLGGLKFKGKKAIAEGKKKQLLNLLYYANSYSKVANLASQTNADLLKLIHSNTKLGTDEAKARVMALMREILLRKTGKWLNHTQMLALLHAAQHNDESSLNQIRTGQGKSLFTIMRVSYRALHGQSGDVVTSKESLSDRDHEEFSSVLDAFGIRHSHIKSSAEAELYYDDKPDANGVGALRYLTIATAGLLFEDSAWNGKEISDKYARNRFIYLDEGDHVMRHEDTAFNFSAQAEGSSIYNFDAWVYEIVYDFYEQHAKSLIQSGIKEKVHLKQLYTLLQKGAQDLAPAQSEFFQTYLASGKHELRKQTLLNLLNKPHISSGLNEGSDFCVMNEQKKISETASIDTRAAKVVINNQVVNGSNFSDLVQQFLHVRLNKELAENGAKFFIDPPSKVVLSLNARHMIKRFYQIIESCTGTPGDLAAVKFYKEEFGIDNVVKLPTHEDIKTQFLPPSYHDVMNDFDGTEEARIAAAEDIQAQKIVADILNHLYIPILITCEDDIAVKRLGTLIQQYLASAPSRAKVVLDTNDSGLSEEDIVKDAGKQHALTISSRMGRGTDIKPYDRDLGIMVIRTYPADPEVEKQEKGRQGRNGIAGIVKDHINYAAVKVALAKYQAGEHEQEFTDIFNYQTKHLADKLSKHKKAGSTKEIWLEMRGNSDLQEQYLTTRSLQHLKRDIKDAGNKFIRARDAVFAQASADVIDKLYELSSRDDIDRFKKAWIVCLGEMSAALSGEGNDEEKLAAINSIVEDFYADQDVEKRIIPTASSSRLEATSSHLESSSSPLESSTSRLESSTSHLEPSSSRGLSAGSTDDTASREGNSEFLTAPTAFYQRWLSSIPEYANQDIEAAIYGPEHEGLAKLYHAFPKLDEDQLTKLTLFLREHPQLCHSISCEAWAQAIDMLAEDEEIAATFSNQLRIFIDQEPQLPQTADEVETLSRNFLRVVEGMPDIKFINKIITDPFYSFRNQAVMLEMVKDLPRLVVSLCKEYMNEADIVCFLNNLYTSEYSLECIRYLSEHHKDLKSHPEFIRPLSTLLLQGTEPSVFDGLFADLKSSKNTAVLLDFLSDRPEFTQEEYTKLQDKIASINSEEKQLAFLHLLLEIPPGITVRYVLSALATEPGKYSDIINDVRLKRCIKSIKTSAEFSNEYGSDERKAYTPPNVDNNNSIWNKRRQDVTNDTNRLKPK
jgi:SecA DEAD-like domain